MSRRHLTRSAGDFFCDRRLAGLPFLLAIGVGAISCHEVSAPVDDGPPGSPPAETTPLQELAIELFLPNGRGSFIEWDTVTVHARVVDQHGRAQTGVEVEWSGPIVRLGPQSGLATLRAGNNTIVGRVGNKGQSPTSASLTIPATPKPGEIIVWSPDGSVSRISAPPGVMHIMPEAINDRGEIVGSFGQYPDMRRAFIWSRESGFSELTSFFAGSDVIAADISEAGVVVGTVWMSSSYSRGFTWSRQDGFALIPGDSPAQTMVSDINRDGSIAGTRDGRPFVWTRERGFSSFEPGGSPPSSYGSAWEFGVAVNDQGDLLTSWSGKYSRGVDYSWVLDGYPSIWTGTRNTSLGCPTCVVSALNNRREVVGVAWQTSTRAFKWSVANGMELLPLGEGGSSEAAAINEAGIVAGSVLIWDGRGFSRAAVWQGSTIKLIDPIPGIHTTTARDINNLGQVLIHAR